MLIFNICDNAGGIKDIGNNNIFDQFYSEKSINSSGIGLYITKKIIEEDMDAIIEVFNDDFGAVFIMTFVEV